MMANAGFAGPAIDSKLFMVDKTSEKKAIQTKNVK